MPLPIASIHLHHRGNGGLTKSNLPSGDDAVIERR